MEIFIISVLILINGFFSLSEIALVSSKRSRLEQLPNSRGVRTALKLLDNSENFLSAVQVGITLIGIIIGVYGGINLADDVVPLFEKFVWTQPFANELALSITVIVITYVSIVIGELVPKTLALNYADKLAIKVAPVIYFFSKLFYPFVKLLSWSTNFVCKLLGIKKVVDHVTEAELRHMLKTASTEGVIEKEQNFIHEKVFYFSDKKAKHLMTPRTDIEWIDLNEPPEEIKDDIEGFQHSKIICCEENIDEFKGVLYIKDYYKQKTLGKEPDITSLLIQPIILPENADAQKVLDQIKTRKFHICVVVNEYGGLEGIITLHDIMENLVGHIPDEGEVYEPDIFVRDDKSVLVSGDAPIETLTEVIEDFSIDFEKIDYATVAGFMLEQLNSIPKVGDTIDFWRYRFEIVDMDGNRIDKLLIQKKEPDENQESK